MERLAQSRRRTQKVYPFRPAFPTRRVVVKGPDLLPRISDVRVRRFDEEFGLDQAEALEVSDHYPVEFTLTV
ncbi:unnamed protein product [Darwinula stevensoni]|uniref:Uncharacterized protein n=1 Tax=Darwinula stevensoni TaxID=69355 RepID=A0A7R9AGK5_9CRUS|nr:unnamed protein product [Darwinula stevensoni]CAG0904436.1 unnamed protein product [Darwinula stevensoni]